LSQVKLIAEPWDLGAGGYQVGNFPVLWSEWNGKYRDCVRHFWKGDGGTASEFATRISGSSDLYQWSGRHPHASINFITCHDGFTLRDLVSYDHKHNEANGEDNRDGADDNHSWNCGAEGPTDDPKINELRSRKQRSLLATLLLSEGVPMLLAGDEMGHSQNGNNNAYCQDNETTWLNWELDDENRELLQFAREVSKFYHSQPVFQRRRFFHGTALRGDQSQEIIWLDPSGNEMSEQNWQTPYTRSLGVKLSGGPIDVDEYGEPIVGDHVLMLFNADSVNDITFTLPNSMVEPWRLVVDTALPKGGVDEQAPTTDDTYVVRASSMVVFCSPVPAEEKVSPATTMPMVATVR
jgi:isoamylase